MAFFSSLRQKKAIAGAKKFLETPIEKIMTPYVVTTRADISVVQAATRMVAQNISCIVVVALDNPLKVEGIVTERDFIKKVPANASALKKKVSDIMTSSITDISPSDPVSKAVFLMRKRGFRKLVVEDDGRLIGILTQTDIVAHALKMMKYFHSKKPLVRDWMSKNLACVKPNSSFADAKKLMIKKDVGALVVKGKEIEGIFTEYDVVAQFYDQGGILQIKTPKEIMHEQIRCIGADETVMYANRVMHEKKVRRLLVVDKGEAIGIITQTDIAHAVFEGAEDLMDPAYVEKLGDVPAVSKKVISSEYVSENFKLYT